MLIGILFKVNKYLRIKHDKKFSKQRKAGGIKMYFVVGKYLSTGHKRMWKVIDTEDLVCTEFKENELVQMICTQGVVLQNMKTDGRQLIGVYKDKSEFGNDLPISSKNRKITYCVIGLVFDRENNAVARICASSEGEVIYLSEKYASSPAVQSICVNIPRNAPISVVRNLVDIYEYVEYTKDYQLLVIEKVYYDWCSVIKKYKCCRCYTDFRDKMKVESRNSIFLAPNEIEMDSKGVTRVRFMTNLVRCDILDEDCEYAVDTLFENLQGTLPRNRKFVISPYKTKVFEKTADNNYIEVVDRDSYLLFSNEKYLIFAKYFKDESRKMDIIFYDLENRKANNVCSINIPISSGGAFKGYIYLVCTYDKYRYDPESFHVVYRISTKDLSYSKSEEHRGKGVYVEPGKIMVTPSYSNPVFLQDLEKYFQ